MREIGLICLFGFTSFDDIKTKQVRVLELIVFGLLGIIINFISPSITLKSIAAGVGIGLVLLLISHITKEKIGKGDAIIIAITGLYLGWINTLVLLWISSIFALIAGVIIIKKYGLRSDHEIPFIPFLTLGYLSMYLIRFIGSVFL